MSRAPVLVMALPLLCGCGTGIPLISSLLSDDSAGPLPAASEQEGNTPTDWEVTESPTTDPCNDNVEIGFTLVDLQADGASIEVEYVYGEGTTAATSVRVTNEKGEEQDKDNLATSRNGIHYWLTWKWRQEKDWPRDEENLPQDMEDVTLKIKLNGKEVSSFLCDKLGNRAPDLEVTVVDTEPNTPELVGVVPLTVTLSDTTSDLVDLFVRYRKKGERDAKPATILGPTTDLITWPYSVLWVFFWDTDIDLGGFDGEVFLNIKVEEKRGDCSLSTTWRSAPPLRIDNNLEPEGLLAGGTERVAESNGNVPVFFLIYDDESDPASAILQWAEQGEEFPSLDDLLKNPPDAEELTDLLTNPDRQGERLAYHILTPAALPVTGQVDALLSVDTDGHILTPAALPVTGQLDALLSVDTDGHTRLREPDFSRRGLAYSLVCGGGCDGEWNPPFLVDRTLRFSPPPGSGSQVIESQITGWRGKKALAVLDDSVEGVTPEWSWDLDANLLPVALPTAPSSLNPERNLYRFVWRSQADLGPRLADVELAVTPFDADRGFEFLYGPRLRLLVDNRVPLELAGNAVELTDAAAAVARGDFDGDGLDDLVVVPAASGADSANSVSVLRQVVPSWPEDLRFELMIELLADAPVAAAPADLDSDGDLDLAVAHAATKISWYHNLGGGQFPPGGSVDLHPLAGKILALAAADLDGDGRADLLVGAQTPPALHPMPLDLPRGGVLIPVYGRRDSLQPGAPVPAGNWPRLLAVAGSPSRNLWIVAAEDGDGTLSVFQVEREPRVEREPSSASTITPCCQFKLGGVVDLAVTDFELDGAEDLAVGLARQLWFLVQDPQKAEFELRAYPDVFTEDLTSLTAADLDGDDKEDLALAFATQAGKGELIVSYYYEPQEGSFAFEERLPALDLEQRPADLARLALVSRGSGALPGLAVLVTGTEGSSIVALGQVRQRLSQVLDPIEAGDLRHWPKTPPAIGDLNNDGMADITWPIGPLHVIMQLPGGTLDEPAFSPLPNTQESRIYSAAIGDLNSDGLLDIVATDIRFDEDNPDKDEMRLRVFMNELGGFTEKNPEVRQGGTLLAIATGDLDQDGDADIVVGPYDASQDTLTLLLQNKEHDGTFTSKEITLPPDIDEVSLIDIAIADVDRDGRNDLVLPDRRLVSPCRVVVLDSDNTYFEELDMKGLQPSDLAVADVDGNGFLDVVVGTESDKELTVFYRVPPQVAQGKWERQNIPLPVEPRSVAAGDMEGDGDQDLVVAGPTSALGNAADRVVILWQGPVTGTGGSHSALPALPDFLGEGIEMDDPMSAIASVDLGDIDSDGDLDIVVSAQGRGPGSVPYRLIVYTQVEVASGR
ncbi:MAG: VCBS repeat-containing protein [Planctomycetota bacterium]